MADADFPWDDDFDGGIDHHEDDAPDDESDVERLCRESLQLLELEELEPARERAMEAVQLDDGHPFPVFVLGLIAEHEGDLPAARYLADQALASAATNADALHFRAQLHVRDGEFEQAEQLLRMGIVHNPDDGALHEQLGRVLLGRGRVEDAARAADTAVRLDPSNPGAHALRAATMEHDGDRESLLAVLRQSVQLNPDDPYTMVQLAAIEAEQGNIGRARVLLARAQRLAPRDQSIADARITIDDAHDHPVLRPLPAMVRWVREFPGGLAGFLLGFVVASLPLTALASREPGYTPLVWSVLAAWGLVALYVWVGPAVLGLRLNRAAARITFDRMVESFDDLDRALVAPPARRPDGDDVHRVRLLGAAAAASIADELPAPTATLDIDVLRDAVLLALAARRWRDARVLLTRAADHAPEDAAGELRATAARIGRPQLLPLRAALRAPGEGRVLSAVAVALLFGSIALASLTGWAAWWFQVAAVVPFALGAAVARAERRVSVDVDARLDAVAIAARTSSEARALRRAS